MIRNIVFDVGMVIAEWKPLEWMTRRYGREKGEAIWRATVESPFWRENIDLGYLSEKEILEASAAACPELAREIRELDGEWYGIFRPIPGTGELAERLGKAGFHLYYLSNFPREAFCYLRERYPAFRPMEGGVASWEVHCCKPDPAIYRALLEKYRLVPGETVFADDVAANVEAARAQGIVAHQFTTAAEFEAYLKGELGLSF